MGKIKRLDNATINKIAAGEVVETPASALKELVENAIDAGATSIAIEHVAGGLKRLVIRDNGCGMSEQDALLCFERHATSKIASIDDVAAVTTKGFRGEALSSIASIAKVILSTSEGEEGVELTVTEGVCIEKKAIGRGRGTTIDVQDLFFNVPARKKFQKSPSQCSVDVLRVSIALFLSSPQVGFTLSSQGVEQFALIPSSLIERIEAVLGAGFTKGCLSVKAERGTIRIEGIVGSPSLTRTNRTGQYLFVNGRYVTAPAVSFAVKDGYGTRIEEKKYPIFVLHVTIPPEQIDVNVHPQKKELRFFNEQEVKNAVRSAVSASFFTEAPLLAEVFENKQPIWKLNEEEKEVSFVYDPMPPLAKEVSLPPVEEVFDFCPRVVGRYSHLLLLEAESLPDDFPVKLPEEGIVVVNLRRAKKRVYFEKLADEMPPMQKLLFPEVVRGSITDEEAELLLLSGIVARPFGNEETIIDAVAEDMQLDGIEEYFSQCLTFLRDGRELLEKRKGRLRLLALSRLRESWPSVSDEKAVAMVESLLRVKEPLVCPLGKPIWKGLSVNELEKGTL